jgi:hypothetical protein
MRRRFWKASQVSSIKLDPSFNRQTKPDRVGGFTPPPVQSKPANGLRSLLYLVVVAAAVGASIVFSYHGLMGEF